MPVPARTATSAAMRARSRCGGDRKRSAGACVVELLVRCGALLAQCLHAPALHFGEVQIHARGLDRGVGLAHLGLEDLALDLDQHLAALDHVAFLDGDALDDAGHARAHLRLLLGLDRANRDHDPFEAYALGDGRGDRGVLAAIAARGRSEHQREERAGAGGARNLTEATRRSEAPTLPDRSDCEVRERPVPRRIVREPRCDLRGAATPLRRAQRRREMIDPSIDFSIAPCSLGRMLVAGTPRGVCFVAFAECESELRERLATRFPFAAPERDDVRLKPWVERLGAYVDGLAARLDVPLDVGGTRFQRDVWAALRRIPRGRTRTYGEIAAGLGRERGARAVARACAANPVPVAIPCHRVVPASGGAGGYAWGTARKRALLEREGVTLDGSEPSCQR